MEVSLLQLTGFEFAQVLILFGNNNYYLFLPSFDLLPFVVCDNHDFKDEKLFYRFRRDDGTYEEPPDAAIVAKGQRIYSRYQHTPRECPLVV